jgi:hypothetical protein
MGRGLRKEKAMEEGEIGRRKNKITENSRKIKLEHEWWEQKEDE